MKEFVCNGKPKNNIQSVIFVFVVVLVFNLIKGFSVLSLWVSAGILAVTFIWFLLQHYMGESLSIVKVDSETKRILFEYVNNTNGKVSRTSAQNLGDTYFVYEFELISRTLSVPVLKIYEGKDVRARLVKGLDCDIELMKILILELTMLGVKGRVTKTEQANTNEFDYIN